MTVAAAKKTADKAEKVADRKLGDVWEVPAGSLVRRPDGVVVTVSGGHVLNMPGEYTCGDLTVTAK